VIDRVRVGSADTGSPSGRYEPPVMLSLWVSDIDERPGDAGCPACLATPCGATGRRRFAHPASPAVCCAAACAPRPACHPLGAVEGAGEPVQDKSPENASSHWLERLYTLTCVYPAPLNGAQPPAVRNGSAQYLTGLEVGAHVSGIGRNDRCRLLRLLGSTAKRGGRSAGPGHNLCSRPAD
jgi:hypothetical protein